MFRYVLEKYGDFVVFWGAELHRRVRCLAIDGYIPTDRLSPYFDTGYIIELSFQCRRSEVNQHPVADVIPVLLRRGQSASREEVVEKRNVCRLMQNSWHRLIMMSECGPSIFYDRLKPRGNHKLPEYPWTTRNPIYVIYKPLLTATLSKLSLLLVLSKERREELHQSPPGTPLVLVLYYLCFSSIHLWFLWQTSCMNRSTC